MKVEMKHLKYTTISPPIDLHIIIETFDDIRILYTLFNVSHNNVQEQCSLGRIDIKSLSNIDVLWDKIDQIAQQYKLG